MKKISTFAFIVSVIFLSACSTPNIQPPATNTPVNVPPTATIIPTSSPTPIPTPLVITSTNVMNSQEEFRIGKGNGLDLAWTPDGNISVLYSSGLTIYDVTGKAIRSVEPDNKAIASDSAMSPDGKFVVSLVNNKNILIWDANTGAIKRELETNCPSSARETVTHKIAFSGDGLQIAACDEGGVSIWNLSTGEKTNTFQVQNNVPSAILFNSTSDLLIVSSSRNPGTYNGFGDIELLDLISGKVIKSFKCKQSFLVTPFVLNHAGDILALTQTGTDLLLFDLNSEKVLKTINVEFKGTYPGRINSMDFTQDDKAIAVSSNYYSGTSIIDIESGEILSRPNVAATIIKFSPDGEYFVAGWDAYFVFRSTDTDSIANLGDFKSYYKMSFDPQGDYIAVGGSLVALWDLNKKKPTLQEVAPWGWLFSFTPDGNKIITNDWNDRDWNHKIATWDRLGHHTSIEDVLEPSANRLIGQMKVCPTSKCVALGIGGNEIKVMSLTTNKLLSSLGPHFFTDFEFSSDGNILASAGTDVTLWDYSTGDVIQTIPSSSPITNITFSPDNKFIVGSTWGKGVHVWGLETGEIARQLTEIEIGRRVEFSPQGDILASLGYDKEGHVVLAVWDFTSAKILYTIVGTQVFEDRSPNYDSPHPELKFSPDGSLIAIKGFSDHIEFVDTGSGKIIKSVDNFKVEFIDEDDTDSFGFSPDGRRFAVAGADGIVRILIVLP